MKAWDKKTDEGKMLKHRTLLQNQVYSSVEKQATYLRHCSGTPTVDVQTTIFNELHFLFQELLSYFD